MHSEQPAPASAGNRDQIDALLDQAFGAYEQGQMDQAHGHFQAVLALDPQDFDALHMLGVMAMQQRQLPQAIALFEQAIASDPQAGMAYTNLGIACMESGLPEKALANFDKAVALEPSVEAFFGRGVVQQTLQQWAATEASFAQVLAMQPTHVAALINRGHACLMLKRLDDAVACYEKAIAIEPTRAGAFAGLGDALLSMQRFPQALAAYDRALALKAEQPDLLGNRASTLLKLAPRNAIILSNLSGALRESARHTEALAMAERALEVDPKLGGAHMNRGNALLDLARLDEAKQAFSMARQVQPDDVEAQWAVGWTSLLSGDWATGLPLFEVRWKKPGFSSEPRGFTQPLWLGDTDLRGRTILLHAEQGLGDTVNFCRYVPLVAELGAKVVLEVQPPLKGLMRSLAGGAQVIARGEPLPAFDVHCPLMSLPLAFKSTPTHLPAPQAYLSADPQQVSALAERLGPRTLPRIGLVWSGNAAHRNDINRSMPLATLMSALPTSGVQYYCLQKDIREADLPTLKVRPDIIRLHDALQGFDGTAALVDQMDLVISVDTSIAHLAGALGKPCWVLLGPAVARAGLALAGRPHRLPLVPQRTPFQANQLGPVAGAFAGNHRGVARLAGLCLEIKLSLSGFALINWRESRFQKAGTGAQCRKRIRAPCPTQRHHRVPKSTMPS